MRSSMASPQWSFFANVNFSSDVNPLMPFWEIIYHCDRNWRSCIFPLPVKTSCNILLSIISITLSLPFTRIMLKQRIFYLDKGINHKCETSLTPNTLQPAYPSYICHLLYSVNMTIYLIFYKKQKSTVLEMSFIVWSVIRDCKCFQRLQ